MQYGFKPNHSTIMCNFAVKETISYLKTKVKINISFNTNNGVKSTKLIKRFMKEFRNVVYLVLELNQFLLQRNDTNCCNANLGMLLIEFM